MTGKTTPAAGWYPDPGGQPGQRYHDGRRWTDHFVPTPPPMPPMPPVAPAVAVAVSNGGGANHVLHAVLTLLSCGLWLPIWILVAIFSGGSSTAVAVSNAGGAIVTRSGRRPLLIVGAVLGGLFLFGLVAEHPWLLVVFAVLGLVAGFGVWVLRSAQQRDEQQRREQSERDLLAQRAEYEDQLYQSGDPRGVHGRYLPPESLRDEPPASSV